MVEQMVSSNLSKYGLGKSASIITTTTATTTISATTAAAAATAASASEVRNVQNDNKPPRSIEEDQAKNAISGSTSGHFNPNLVYARRKSDADLNNSDKSQTTSSAYQQQAASDKMKPNEISAHNHVATTTTNIKNFENEQILSKMELWNARFTQLHNYLKQCDNSNQEVYLQKLRSFSPDECNRHAVELERRAIQLTMQEGLEMMRVRDLNMHQFSN